MDTGTIKNEEKINQGDDTDNWYEDYNGWEFDKTRLQPKDGWWWYHILTDNANRDDYVNGVALPTN